MKDLKFKIEQIGFDKYNLIEETSQRQINNKSGIEIIYIITHEMQNALNNW